MSDIRYSEVCARLKILSVTAAGMIPTKLPLEPTSSDMREIIKDLEIIARDVDALLSAYGRYVDANAPCIVDRTVFEQQLLGALDGNAFHEITEAADAIHERNTEAAQ